MRKVGDRGVDALTVVHKLVGAAWLFSALGVLWFVLPALRSGSAAWESVLLLVRVAAYASVVTFVTGLAYSVATPWGLLKSRWVMGKWALYLMAVSASGYSISAARERSIQLVALLAAAQVAVLATSMAIGVFLERSRNAGRLPR